MRDQLLVQKVGNRSGMGAKGRSGTAGQRPQRRDRDAGQTLGARLRVVFGYFPHVLKFALLAAIGVVVFLGYRAAASASFFQMRNIETRGIARSSVEAVQATVRRDVGKTGVWRADLEEVRAHLERLPWVRTAVVSRVLPDGIRVRISERLPRAVVRTSAGRLVWVDEDAVVLSEMVPSDQMPNFFLRGWNEEESTAAQAENRERVRKFLELQHDWDAPGLSDRVSEVNLLDIRDVRAQLAGDDSQIEVRLGSLDLGLRLKQALNVLDKQRQTSRGPFISYIDITQGKRAIVGLVSGNHAVSDVVAPGSDSGNDAANVPADERAKSSKSAADKSRRDKDRRAKKGDPTPG